MAYENYYLASECGRARLRVEELEESVRNVFIKVFEVPNVSQELVVKTNNELDRTLKNLIEPIERLKESVQDYAPTTESKDED